MTDGTGESDIRAIIEARTAAVRAGDADAMVVDVAEEIVTFDVVDPLRRIGKAGERERANEWTASYDGPVAWESRDVVVEVADDLVFSHSLSHVTGKLKTGAAIDMWFRTTLGLRRTGDRWLIVHEHNSSPFNPDTGAASVGLKPA